MVSANRMLQRGSKIVGLFMFFKPFRDPFYKVSFLSLHRQILRLAERLEVIDRQLSRILNGPLITFTNNVPW